MIPLGSLGFLKSLLGSLVLFVCFLLFSLTTLWIRAMGKRLPTSNITQPLAQAFTQILACDLLKPLSQVAPIPLQPSDAPQLAHNPAPLTQSASQQDPVICLFSSGVLTAAMGARRARDMDR